MNDFMYSALLEAKKGLLAGETPVGAVIVLDGKIIAQSHNKTKLQCDPTAHAEIIALRSAAIYLNTIYLTHCDLYVTLEPCHMCAHAISLARIRRLYFGAYDEKSGGIENGAHIYHSKSTHHKPEYYGGVRSNEASALMKDFFSNKR